MTRPSPRDITQMLIDWNNGDREALDSLMFVVYSDHRRVADDRQRRFERGEGVAAT